MSNNYWEDEDDDLDTETDTQMDGSDLLNSPTNSSWRSAATLGFDSE